MYVSFADDLGQQAANRECRWCAGEDRSGAERRWVKDKEKEKDIKLEMTKGGRCCLFTLSDVISFTPVSDTVNSM